MSKLGDIFDYGVRQARRWFHALVGVTFLVLGMAGAVVSFQEWRVYQQAPGEGTVKFWAVAGFTIFLVILGLYSFAKARGVR